MGKGLSCMCNKYPILPVRVASSCVCSRGEEREERFLKGNSLLLSTSLIWQQGAEETVKSSADTKLSSLLSSQHTAF